MAQAETTVDVLIVGAGLSGIGAAAHLTMQCPNKSYAIVEQRADMGGTWDLFRYPGIRSDSDMQTFGFGFRPFFLGSACSDPSGSSGLGLRGLPGFLFSMISSP